MAFRCIGLSLLGLWILACSAPAAPQGDSLGEPLVRGEVGSVDHRATASGILVSALPGSREMCGIAATADSATRVYRRGASGELSSAAVKDVAIGDTVEVYVDGPVAESCPVQGRADAIVIDSP